MDGVCVVPSVRRPWAARAATRGLERASAEAHSAACAASPGSHPSPPAPPTPPLPSPQLLKPLLPPLLSLLPSPLLSPLLSSAPSTPPRLPPRPPPRLSPLRVPSGGSATNPPCLLAGSPVTRPPAEPTPVEPWPPLPQGRSAPRRARCPSPALTRGGRKSASSCAQLVRARALNSSPMQKAVSRWPETQRSPANPLVYLR